MITPHESPTAPLLAAANPPDRAPGCQPGDRLTRSLLGYGIIAGPFYVAVSLAQALTRQGFDVTRHAWSTLANGALGWIQIANLILTGLMVIAFAVGLRRALAVGTGACWAPRLVGVYGTSLIVAGIFRADPARGFPIGSPDPGDVTWHGLVHLAAGAIGFGCICLACVIIGRRYAAERRSGWARFSILTGLIFLASFLGLAATGGRGATTVAFVCGVIALCGWMTAVAVDRYRRVAPPVAR